MAGFPEIPGYELQAELGRGGMAVVYSAIETNLGRQVAIKVVTGIGGDPDGQIERLENEARGLAALHHPHIVDLYRFGRTADGALFYVMPLLPGGSLEDWPRPVPEERVLALLDPLLDALGHAHAADIIHRDIKPANILFDRHERPLLADFGAAFMRRRSTRLTSHGGAIGSSGYMSPEQARGLDVDARSDLYSTAVLAFELLSGQRPFAGPDDLAIAIAQTEQPVPKLPDALRHWQAFFARALAVKPEQRFADAAEMRTAIHALRQEAAPASRRPGMAIALSALVLVLSALAFATWRTRTPAPLANTGSVAASSHAGTATPPGNAAAAAAATATARELPAFAKAVGDHFADAGGPELVLVQEAKGTRPALSVMAAAVDEPLYQRFASDRGRKTVTCSDTAAPAQACLDLATANELARWLSEQTKQRYRVPSRTELAGAIARVAPAPAHAWTSTCREVRVARPRNVAQRSWSRVRKWVGKPKPVQYDVRCDGHYALKLDGGDGTSATAYEQASSQTVVVLARED